MSLKSKIYAFSIFILLAFILLAQTLGSSLDSPRYSKHEKRALVKNWHVFGEDMNMTFQDPPKPKDDVKQCLNNISQDINTCMIIAVKRWHITSKSSARNKCCAAWNIIDCTDDSVRSNCSESEISDTEVYFDQVIHYWEENICADYSYHSSTCSSPQEASLLIYLDSYPRVFLFMIFLLAMFLISVSCFLCIILVRQMRQERIMNEILPKLNANDYQRFK